MFKAVIAGIKGLKFVQAKLDAADDDLDKDGLPEFENGKREYALIWGKSVAFVKDVQPHVIKAFQITVKLFAHIMEAD
jgi:hypothetical protein